MDHNADIIEVSDPRDMTITVPVDDSVPEIRVVKGRPTDEELAALVTVLSAAGGGRTEPGPQELNELGHPVDKLRYSHVSWQMITLVERTHMRR